MKKITAVLLAMILMGTQLTTVLAEFTREDFIRAAVENNSMPDTMDVSVLDKDENGGYVVKSNDSFSQEEIENAFKYYEFATYSKPEEYDGSGIAGLLAENISDPDCITYYTYDGNELYRISYVTDNFINAINELYETPWWGDYHLAFLQDDPTALAKIDSAIEDLNQTAVSEIHDAYLFDWFVGGIKTNKSKENSDGKTEFEWMGVYFSTEKGEFIIPHSQYFEAEGVIEELVKGKIEAHKVYPIEEFLALVNAYYDEGEKIGKKPETDAKQEPGEETETDIEEAPEQLPEDDEYVDVYDGPRFTELPVIVPATKPEKDTEEEPAGDGFIKTDMSKIDVLLYGEPLEFKDQEPIIVRNRVLVPLRAIFEALGADVLWDDATKTVTTSKGDITISLTIGEKKLIKNGERIDLDVEAQIMNSRTLVPIRAVSESFENNVSWDGENKIVRIY